MSELEKQFSANGSNVDTLKPYDPKKSWSKAAQPADSPNMTTNDYVDIAEAFVPQATEKISGFMDGLKTEYGLSYLIVPHAEFKTGYEDTDLPFRTWLEQYCKTTNQCIPDFLVVWPRVKGRESAARKADGGYHPGRIIDYLAFMVVAIKKRPNQPFLHNRSIENLAYLLAHYEVHPNTVAHKNYFWTPHKGGLRAYKGLWKLLLDEDLAMELDLRGNSLLLEGKIQHASQMDLDKATRAVMDIERLLDKVIAKISYNPAPPGNKQTEMRAACMNAFRNLQKQRSSRKIAIALYNYFHWATGLDKAFHNPEYYPTVYGLDDILYIIESCEKSLPPPIAQKLRDAIELSGVKDYPIKQNEILDPSHIVGWRQDLV